MSYYSFPRTCPIQIGHEDSPKTSVTSAERETVAVPSCTVVPSPNLAMNWLNSPSARRSHQPGPLLPGWTDPTEHAETEQ